MVVVAPIVLCNLCLDACNFIIVFIEIEGDGHLQWLVRQIGDIHRVWQYNVDFAGLIVVDNVPIGVVGIVLELQCHLVVGVAHAVEVVHHVFAQHAAVDDFAARRFGTVVHIIACNLNVGSVRLIVLAFKVFIFVLISLRALHVLVEEHRLGIVGMVAVIVVTLRECQPLVKVG